MVDVTPITWCCCNCQDIVDWKTTVLSPSEEPLQRTKDIGLSELMTGMYHIPGRHKLRPEADDEISGTVTHGIVWI